MRLTALFLTLFLVQVSARTSAQQVSLSAKSLSLETAFSELKKQTGMAIFYSPDDIVKTKPVSVDLKNVTLQKALETLLKDQPLEYTIKGNTVFVTAKKQPTAAVEEPAAPPAPITVRGRVTNDKGEPIAGVSVIIKGTSRGTSTDDKGEFTLSGVDVNATLEFSSINSVTSSFKVVSDKDFLTIALKPKTTQLEDIAVTVNTGYEKIPKERATGSFAFLNNELVNRRISTDFISRLEGVTPGVLFNRNVASGQDISIRGRSTLFSNSQPLIVVDNFPYDGSLDDINPNDIENITVLKDAAATSIWGAQSGNGVIVVTTKKGKRSGPLQIELNTNVTSTARPDVFYNRSFMSSSDYIGVEQYLFGQGYYDSRLTNPSHPPLTPVVQLLAAQRAGTMTAAQVNAQLDQFKTIDVRNDISKYYYQKALQQQYFVGVRGGSGNADYYFSAGIDGSKFGLVGNQYNRLTLNSKTNFYIGRKLTFSVGMTYVQSKTESDNTLSGLTMGSGTGIYPYAKLADGNGNPLPIVKDYNTDFISDPVAQAGRLNWQYYPLKELALADNSAKIYNTRISLGFNYTIIKDLSFDGNYTYEKVMNPSSTYYADSSYYARDMYNRFYNPGGTVTAPIPLGGILQQRNNDITSHRGRVQLNYNRTFHNNHRLNGLVGAEISQVIGVFNSPFTMYGYDRATGNYFPVDYIDYFPQFPVGNSSNIPTSYGLSTSTNRTLSYFGNAAYTYKNRYVLSVSGRVDKSNLFAVATNQKATPLYSAGLSWDISKESFYHISFIPYLRVRTTFGYSGNINKSQTAIPTIVLLNTNYYNPAPYAAYSSFGNPLLRWEKVGKYNFGIDFATKNNVLSGSIEYYSKTGNDVFGNTVTAPSTGLSAFFGNVANIKGHGLEVTLNATPIKSQSFTWLSTFLFSNELDKTTKYTAKSAINSYLLAGADEGSIQPIEGKPIFSIYSFRSAGLNNNGDPQGFQNGVPSTNYSQIISSTPIDSLVYNGSARPTIYGALRNTFTYKKWSLSVNIIYKLNYFFRRSSINYYGLYTQGAVDADFANRWQKPGDELITNVPSMPTVANLNSNRDLFYEFSDKLVDKGDHIRLQDISIGYTFDKVNIMKGAIKAIKLYGYVNNIGIIWRANNDHLDPDVYSGGLPNPRSVAIGVNMSF